MSSKSTVPAAEIPRLLSDIYQALSGLAGGKLTAGPANHDPGGAGEKVGGRPTTSSAWNAGKSRRC